MDNTGQLLKLHQYCVNIYIIKTITFSFYFSTQNAELRFQFLTGLLVLELTLWLSQVTSE